MNAPKELLSLLDLPPGWDRIQFRELGQTRHPTEPLICLAADNTLLRTSGMGVWNTESGALVRWLPDTGALAWFATGTEVVEVTGAGLRQILRRRTWPAWQTTDEIEVAVTRSGCAIEEVAASRSGRWIVTQRLSGQGEWGYDLFETTPLRRVGGIDEDRFGYMLDLPTFSDDESRLVLGYGESWLGGWWAHPDDDPWEPARGGTVTFGWLLDHRLADHYVSAHELRMEIPVGWIPDDPEAPEWYGPRHIEPAGRGVRMRLPGGHMFEMTGPLPEVILLPTPSLPADSGDARTPMPGTTRFNLRIDTPKHGWADTTVKLGDTTVVISASDVGPDCFRELASVGLFAIQAHEGSQSAEFFEEPCGHIIRVTHGGSGDLTVTIHDTGDLMNATARQDLVASLVMPRAEFRGRCVARLESARADAERGARGRALARVS